MARYTRAYSSLVQRLGEVDTLRRLASAGERDDPLKRRAEINAACRGAIVLLSAHLEAYVREVGEVALEAISSKAVPRRLLSSRVYYHISQDLLREVSSTQDPEKIAEKVFKFLARDGAYWSVDGPFPSPVPADRFNKGFANPAFKKIKAYFGRFGYSRYTDDLARALKSEFQLVVNMVDHVVDTRHKIAHGDPNATKTPAEVEEAMQMVRRFCGATDAVFAAWCRSGICAIR